jgi:hypothetical protein
MNEFQSSSALKYFLQSKKIFFSTCHTQRMFFVLGNTEAIAFINANSVSVEITLGIETRHFLNFFKAQGIVLFHFLRHKNKTSVK